MPQRLKIIAPAAGGAGVDQHPGMSLAQFVPKRQVPFHVADLSHPLAIGCVGLAPEIEGIHVEILSVQIDSFISDQPVDVVNQPLPRRLSPSLKRPPPAPPQIQSG